MCLPIVKFYGVVRVIEIASDVTPVKEAHRNYLSGRTISHSAVVIERHRQRRNNVKFKRYNGKRAWWEDSGDWNGPEEKCQDESQGHRTHRVPREQHQRVVQNPEKVVDCCNRYKALSKGVPGHRNQQSTTLDLIILVEGSNIP
jgi:hypothetical protein